MVRRMRPNAGFAALLGLAVLGWLLLPVAMADDYAANWGPAVGGAMPLLQAPDQSGAARSLPDLAGEQGLLLFLVRSADW